MTSQETRVTQLIVIAGATLSAVLLAWESSPSVVWLGAGLTLPLMFQAARSSWLGLLALFSLAFAIRPAPPAIGVQETVFAVLAGIVMVRSLTEGILAGGWRYVAQRYGRPLAIGGLLAVANLTVALSLGVSLGDWLRGVVPFLFLVLAMPLAQALEVRPERLHWLGWGVVSLIVLMAGHVVLYFLWHGLNNPYWMTVEGMRIDADLLSAYPNASGPIYERVTMHLTRATDALLPAGLVMAVAIAIRTRDMYISSVASLVAFLSLAAILMTYTRSMALAAACVLFVFILAVAIYWRYALPSLLKLIVVLVVCGGVLVFALGIESIWIYRVGQLGGVDDDNVTTRLEEIQIAWQHFLAHPLLGNGLGAKHAMRFYGPGGVVEQQVAYIHNWLFYALMAGGAIGFIAYAWVLLTPVTWHWRSIREESPALTAIRNGVLVLAVYGLMFAVFRLITFNLLLAAAWGVMLAHDVSTTHMRKVPK